MDSLPFQTMETRQDTGSILVTPVQANICKRACSGSSSKPEDNSSKRTKVDFSIDAILSRTQPASKSLEEKQSESPHVQHSSDDPQFSWVYCTRYRPPKLPRVKRDVSNVRARYRNPRIPFSTTEVTALERKFVQSPYLGSTDVNDLAASLNMSPKRVYMH